jgi:hypothetical protein
MRLVFFWGELQEFIHDPIFPAVCSIGFLQHLKRLKSNDIAMQRLYLRNGHNKCDIII